MKKLHTYVLKQWPFYLLALISMFIAIGLDMLYPQITKVIVNEVFKSGDMNRLPMLLAAIALCGVGRAIFGYIKEIYRTSHIDSIYTITLIVTKDIIPNCQYI